jgi:5-methylcytosine-specific restriction protein A
MRTEFSEKTKAEAALRAKGKCKCTARLFVGNIFYDHIIPDAMGGDNTLGNCQVLCRACHDSKTRTRDVPQIAKAKRLERKRFGIKSERKIRAWRKFDGTPVYAGRER